MNYQIRSLGYDEESDELDLLINATEPQPAEAVEVDAGMYVRRDFQSGQVVGAFIRGYRRFAQQVQRGELKALPLAEQAGLREVAQAIVHWQREVGQLSHALATHLTAWPPEKQWLEAQLTVA
jgi:hypothetical protein